MSDYQSDTYSNIPNESLAFTMYTNTFGNGDFQIITPTAAGGAQTSFPTIPYLSLEAILFSQMATNPATNANNIQSGASSGQQSIGGTITARDSTGTSRNSQGYIPTQ